MTGTPVARLILIGPGVEVKAVEGNALVADRNFRDAGSNLAVESVAVHAEIGGRVAKTDEAGVTTIYAYDERGNLTNRTLAAGMPEERVTSFAYDAYGNLTNLTEHGNADTLEAVLGAIYLDAGSIDACRDVVHTIFSSHLSDPGLRLPLKDPKTQLQELLQSRKMPLPEYAVVDMSEAHHAHSFVVECRVTGLDDVTVGHGGTRRAAEQEAARMALKRLTRL